MMAKLHELTNQIIRKRLTIPIYTHTNTINLFMNYETDAFMTIALILAWFCSRLYNSAMTVAFAKFEVFCCCQGLIEKIDGYDRIWMARQMHRTMTY